MHNCLNQYYYLHNYIFDMNTNNCLLSYIMCIFLSVYKYILSQFKLFYSIPAIKTNSIQVVCVFYRHFEQLCFPNLFTYSLCNLDSNLR